MYASYLTHIAKLRKGIGAIPVCPGIPFNCVTPTFIEVAFAKASSSRETALQPRTNLVKAVNCQTVQFSIVTFPAVRFCK